MKIRESKPSLSVIVPLYNGEKYLHSCLDSLCRQSLTDLEIIVVDDGSTDSGAAIAKEYAVRDSRVRVCMHDKNQGSLQARITGVEAARGDYIGFVDADDEISIDWFRMLYSTAQAQQNDITAGQFLSRFEDGRLEYFNLDPMRRPFCWEGEEIFSRFMEQEGSCYSWWLLWNKLYARALWDGILPQIKAFSQSHRDLTMCEDIALSAALWLSAGRVGNITGGAYYYYRQHDGASTSAKKSREKIFSDLQDVSAVFDFLEAELIRYGRQERDAKHLYAWRLRYARLYHSLLKGNRKKGNAEDAEKIRLALSLDDGADLDRIPPAQEYFYSIRTVADPVQIDRMEQLKQLICSDEIDTVSFDVFDTLVVRPFFHPSDLFYLLNDRFASLCSVSSYLQFSDIRVNAERECRKRIRRLHPEWEDVTLDEIYEQIALDYPIGEDVLNILKQEEQALELRFCSVRQSGKQLLELARERKKRVIICSDMYLPQQTVEQILQKNQYTYDRIYLSSALRVGKWTKHLFQYVQKELGLRPQQLLHIGDSLESDVKHPREAGWNSAHLPRTLDHFRNLYPDFYGGELYSGLVGYHGQMRDGINAEYGFLGYRCALALAVNRLFDDPFALLARDSDFDADPYRIGYFALGHYLYSLTDWLTKKAKREGRERIHFVARDGYLPMEAYAILQQYDPTLPKSHYLYVSRKALALTDVYTPIDLFSFWGKFPPANYSPLKFEKLLKPYYRSSEASLREKLGMDEKSFQKKFSGRTDYDRALTVLAELVDFEKLELQKVRLKSYFGSLVRENDLLFDIGYSGRAEAALTRLLGYPVSGAYVHDNTQAMQDRERIHGFQTECFYSSKPIVSGMVREHVFMKLAGSAVGYEERDGVLEPILEDEEINCETRVFTEIMQSAALDFVRDMCKIFAGYTDLLAYRHADLAYSFEYYLHYAKPKDRAVFSCVVFEDELGYGKAVSALDYWVRDLTAAHLNTEEAEAYLQDQRLRTAFMPYPRWKKALCYLILDRGHFLDSLKRLFKK